MNTVEIEKHILYYKLIANKHALKDILDIFLKILEDRGIDYKTRGFRNHLEGMSLHEDFFSRDDRHAIQIIATFMEELSPSEVVEYINYGRKAAIVRKLLHFLELEHENFIEINQLLKEFSEIPQGSVYLPTTLTLDIRIHLISHLLNTHLSFVSIAKNYINLRDIAKLLENNIAPINATGQIGGKASGMILANRILRPTIGPDTVDVDLGNAIEEVDSFFVKSSVISEFVALNALEETRTLKYLEGDEFDKLRDELYKKFMAGKFPKDIEHQFKELLKKTRGTPLIIRSSSFLEDGVDCSFTGKYDSVFISNMGKLDERLVELETAIKQVYFSLYSSSVIQYRKDKNLIDFNERMSVLIQKVVGSRYGKYYFPAIAAVGFSHNSFCWNKRIKPEDGMLRIVMGLGTRAVDRVGQDYPRLVSLTAPKLRPEVTAEEKIKYSQKYVDVLNLESRKVETIHVVDLVNELWENGHDFDISDIISINNNGHLSAPMFRPDTLDYSSCAITFDGLLSNKKFTDLMKKIFRKVEAAYGKPVDMEFAYHNDKLYVLQCRTLSQREAEVEFEIPDIAEEHIIFNAKSVSHSVAIRDIQYIVYIHHDSYDQLETSEKRYECAKTVGKLNKALAEKQFILMGPGRWGSSDINLGIPVRYGDINHTKVLIEMGWEKDGVVPELSFGTHFFQDLVEANIIPLPIYPKDEDIVFRNDFFTDSKNEYSRFEGLPPEFESIIKVIDVKKASKGALLNIFMDASSSTAVAALLKK